ncbi:MAG: hypothetical protein V3U82_02410 [Robiginitomaculum sp.]
MAMQHETNAQAPSGKAAAIPKAYATDYIADMLGELAEMAGAAGLEDLSKLIRFTHRAAIMQDA